MESSCRLVCRNRAAHIGYPTESEVCYGLGRVAIGSQETFPTESEVSDGQRRQERAEVQEGCTVKR